MAYTVTQKIETRIELICVLRNALELCSLSGTGMTDLPSHCGNEGSTYGAISKALESLGDDPQGWAENGEWSPVFSI